MKRNWTISDLKNSAAASLNQKVIEELENPKKSRKKRVPSQPCKQVLWMGGQLAWWALTTGIMVEKEWRFHPVRKWRFDFFIPSLKIACEYEGIFSKKSRHTTQSGYCGDVEKYREAAKMDITVFRYTSKDYKNVLKDLQKYVDGRTERTMETNRRI